MDASAEEGFIGVDIADAGEGGLIEEERFDGAVRAFAGAGEIARGDGKGIGAEGRPAELKECVFGWIGGEATEAARVDEEELGIVVEAPEGVGVFGNVGCEMWDVGWEEEKASGHAELDAEGGAVVGVNGELLAAAGEARDAGGVEEVV